MPALNSGPATASGGAAVATPSAPAALPSSLSSLSASALVSELSASASACARLDRELDELMAQRGELERAVGRAVPTFQEQLDSLRRTHTNINATVRTSAASAHALASKVRDLDLAASHVQSALQRVESVLQLRHTITRVREKLAAGSLGSAGDELYKALFVQQPIEGDVSFLMLLELERKAREEVQAQALQRYVRQARNTEAAAASAGGRGAASQQQQQQSALESTAIFKLARIWPKLGCNYRGVVMHCAQVRHECLSLIHRSGWSVSAHVAGAVIDYSNVVGHIIDAVNQCIVQHLLAVQDTFGPGAQVRLLQELVTNVIDVEVAKNLLGRFMDDRRIREPAKGSHTPADDICSRIKQINQRVSASASGRGGDLVVSYYNPHDTSGLSSSLPIQQLDELLDELRALAHDMDGFLKGVHSLTRQSLDFLHEAVAKETEARENAQKQTPANTATGTATRSGSSSSSSTTTSSGDEAFARFLSNPNDLTALPSVHQQHDRVMTLLHTLLRDDKQRRNLLDVPLSEERTNVFASTKPSIAPDTVLPPAQLHLPPSSPFLLHGFGLDPHVATSSQLYDVLLTLIGKYVLIEEYYMNVNVEKALAIDEHDGSAAGDDDAKALAHDDLESELEAAEARAKERERQAQAGGLHSLASAAMTSLHAGAGGGGGVDPYLYLTGIGGALSGSGLPRPFVARFSTHRTSTLVDNVCFIYKKCVQRSLRTSNRDAIYSILLRVHENFNRKLRRIFEHSIGHYEARFGSKKKSSITYALHQNPAAYLFPQQQASGGKGSAANNLLGAWVSSAASGIGSAAIGVGGAGPPSAVDVRRKVNADVSLLLTVNNLDSTIENMQALMRHIDTQLDQIFADEQQPAQATHADGNNGGGSNSGSSSSLSSSNYSRGLSLDQLRDKVLEFHSTFHAFDHLVNRGLDLIADNVWLRLLPRLALLQLNSAELYGQEALSASAADKSDMILAGFIELFRRDVASLAPLLNENNFYQLVFKVARRTARYIEGLLLPTHTQAQQAAAAAGDTSAQGGAHARILFTQSGGVQFDKQVRTLSSFFTNDVAAQLERHFASNFFLSLTPPPSSSGGLGASSSPEYPPWRVSFSGAAQARQLFSKLAHAASILSVDRPAEVLDYTDRELFNLSKDEVKRILSLRKEFSERDINALKL